MAFCNLPRISMITFVRLHIWNQKYRSNFSACRSDQHTSRRTVTTLLHFRNKNSLRSSQETTGSPRKHGPHGGPGNQQRSNIYIPKLKPKVTSRENGYHVPSVEEAFYTYTRFERIFTHYVKGCLDQIRVVLNVVLRTNDVFWCTSLSINFSQH